MSRPGGAASATAGLGLLRAIGIAVPDRIESIAARLSRDTPGVALIGLFNRGKSTLFNQLVGSPVSPIGALPTTAVLVEAATGPAAAVARYPDHTVQLPTEPSAFAAHLDALEAPRPAEASITGGFRMPPGLRLVDTPGVGAVSDLDEANWWQGSIGAAALVMAVPPGPSAEDREVLDCALEIFDGNVIVCLKAVDTEVTSSDLTRAAHRGESDLGVEITVLPGDGPLGPWASDSGWQILERRLDERAAAIAGTRSAQILELTEWIDSHCSDLARRPLSLAERAAWLAVDPDQRAVAPGHLVAVIDGAAARAEQAWREEVQLESETERRRAAARREVLARRSLAGTRLVAWLDGARSTPDYLLSDYAGECHRQIRDAQAWAAGVDDYPELEAMAKRLSSAAALLSLRMMSLAGHNHEEALSELFRLPVYSPESWQAEADVRMRSALSWLESPQIGSPSLSGVRTRVTTAYDQVRIHGPTWAQQTFATQRAAADKRQQTYVYWQWAFGGSFVLWGIAIVWLVAALANPPTTQTAFGTATETPNLSGPFVLWLISFGVWVASLTQLNAMKDRGLQQDQQLPPPPNRY